MKIECNGCGKQYEDSYEFCPHCGTRRGDFKLMKYNKELKKKETRKKLFYLIPLAIIVLVIVASITFAKLERRKPLIIPDSALGRIVPVMEGLSGNFEYEGNDMLYFDIYDDVYDEYVNLCIDQGFDIDSNYSDYSYVAYNQDGYKIDIWRNDENINVSLYNKINFEETPWPRSGLGALLPEPLSKKHKITNNSEDYFEAYIGMSSLEDFVNYCELCVEQGFDVDFYRYEKNFYSSNADGVSLSIYYEGYNTFHISLYKN